MKNTLLEAKEELDSFLEKKVQRTNMTLWRVENGEKYKEANILFFRAFVRQVQTFLRSQAFEQMVKNPAFIENSKHIWTEADSNHVKRTVDLHIQPLKKFIEEGSIYNYFIYLAEVGGQSFIDNARKRTMKAAKIPAAASTSAIFVLKNPMYQRILGRKANLLITSVDNTTKQWLSNQIISGKAEGVATAEIVKTIQTKIPETFKYRADMIVRTETSNIVNQMENQTAQNNDATDKEWQVAGENVCDICDGNEGDVIGMDASFPSGDDLPPAHPNCKCYITYTVPPYIDFSNPKWTGQ